MFRAELSRGVSGSGSAGIERDFESVTSDVDLHREHIGTGSALFVGIDFLHGRLQVLAHGLDASGDHILIRELKRFSVLDAKILGGGRSGSSGWESDLVSFTRNVQHNPIHWNIGHTRGSSNSGFLLAGILIQSGLEVLRNGVDAVHHILVRQGKRK